MKKNIIVSAAFIIMVLLQSCSNVEPVTSKAIDSKVIFKFYEWYPVNNGNQTGAPEMYLGIYTEKAYPCCNYTLNSTKVINGKDISITLNSLIEPDICLTAFGPATENLPFKLQNGEYNFSINLNHVKNNYTVNVSNKNITVKANSGDNTTPLYHNYYRYPANTFVYMCGTTLTSKYIYEDFLDTLKSKINIVEYKFPEDGQKPYPNSMGGHYYEPHAKYFTYQSEEDFDKIGKTMNAYIKSHLNDWEGVGISITNWLNKNFYSWIDY
jgi:hypothetical protein